MTIFNTCPIKSFFNRNKSNSATDSNIPYYEKRMRIWRKLAYGMGGPPMQMLSNAMAFFLPIFLLETAKVNPYYLSAIQMIARVWDAITDPIAGYLVSRTKSRFGKYKPWIFCSTPIACISFFLLFFVINTPNEALKFAFYCFAIVALQTGLTGFHVPYSSMCMLLTSNVQDRDQLTSFRMAFEIMGVIFGAGVFGVLATRNRIANYPNNTTITDSMINLEKTDYMFGSLAVCVIFVICSICVLIGTKEVEILKDQNIPYLKNLKKIMTFKPYLLIMFAFMFTSLGIQLVQSNLALYVTHTLALPKHVTPGILVLLVCSFLLVPLGHKLLIIFGKKKVFLAGIFNMMPILGTLAFLPKHVHLAIFYVYMVWTSFTVMVSILLPWSMLPDVIDLFMIQNGCRMESTFYSFYVFFNKFAVGISLFISAFALGLAGYDTNARTQPESVAKMLRYYVGFSGMFCFIVSMIFLYFYPITEEKRHQMVLQLEEMRQTLKSTKMSTVTTFETDLENIGEPTKQQKQNVNLAAENWVKSENSENVDFVIGSQNTLRT